MKAYENPTFDLITATECDVIAASAQGTETKPYPESGGIWDLEIG